MEDLETDIRENTEIITNNINNYLLPAKFSTEFLAWFSRKHSTSLDASDDLVFQSLKLLDLYPQIAGIFSGDKLGNFIAIKRIQQPEMYPFSEKKPLPANAVFGIRTINRSTSVVTEFHRFLDQDGRTVAVEERPRAYDYFDPRNRPWYKATLEKLTSIWSDPYQFKLSGTIGITAATPIVETDNSVRIVVSADMTLDAISKIVAQNKIGRTGKTVILDDEGGVVGYPELNKYVNTDESTLPNYKDLKDPVLVRAFEHFKKSQDHMFNIDHESVTYIARFHNFGDNFNKKWTLIFLVPEKELTGPVTEMTQLMLLFSLMIVVVSVIFIYLLSKNIARPITIASKSMQKISKFEIDDHDIKDSQFTEIQVMNDALRKMRQSLYDFSRFVPKAVVTKLIESGSGAQIGGKKRHITLMFTDIKSFSTISEHMSSEKLIKHLSDYLNQMTVIIQEEQGTIDKYIGDAIMTFWGAPIEDPSHPIMASRAALRCRDALTSLNKTWRLDGKPPLETRFGLHTGDAIVGNVGSEDRLNYSAFGDSVNLAARLESANRFYGTHILISHDTYKNVRHQFICRPIDMVAVKGKEEVVPIYELIIEKSDEENKKLDMEAAEQKAHLTETAFNYYRNQEWNKAIRTYEELKMHDKSDELPKVFIERCNHFKNNRPEKAWDGTWVMTEK